MHTMPIEADDKNLSQFGSEMWEIEKSFGYFLVNPTWIF
jgi:hypothetical protein